MLISVSVWFIVCNLPWSVFAFLNPFTYPDPLLEAALLTLMNLNAVGNFYLYLVSGKMFRQNVVKFFKDIRCRLRSQNTSSTFKDLYCQLFVVC